MNTNDNETVEAVEFGGLSYDQRRFLAKRLTCGSDAEACRALKLNIGRVTRWHKNAEFEQEYLGLANDGIILARAMIRQQLGESVATLVRERDTARATRDRVDAAWKLLTGGGIGNRLEVTGADGKPIEVAVKGYVSVSPDDFPAPASANNDDSSVANTPHNPTV